MVHMWLGGADNLKYHTLFVSMHEKKKPLPIQLPPWGLSNQLE